MMLHEQREIMYYQGKDRGRGGTFPLQALTLESVETSISTKLYSPIRNPWTKDQVSL